MTQYSSIICIPNFIMSLCRWTPSLRMCLEPPEIENRLLPSRRYLSGMPPLVDSQFPKTSVTATRKRLKNNRCSCLDTSLLDAGSDCEWIRILTTNDYSDHRSVMKISKNGQKVKIAAKFAFAHYFSWQISIQYSQYRNIWHGL